MSQTFCAIDFETANGSRGSVCAIGLVRLDTEGRILDADGGLVTPPAGHDRFLPNHTRIHHITERMVRQAHAPAWPAVLDRLIDFVGDDLLVAHNAAFERSVIRAASAAHGLDAPDLQVVCTVKMSRAVLPELVNHKLPTVAQALGVPLLDHHDAVNDAAMCGLITSRLLGRCTPGTTLEHLAAACGEQVTRPLPL